MLHIIVKLCTVLTHSVSVGTLMSVHLREKLWCWQLGCACDDRVGAARRVRCEAAGRRRKPRWPVCGLAHEGGAGGRGRHERFLVRRVPNIIVTSAQRSAVYASGAMHVAIYLPQQPAMRHA